MKYQHKSFSVPMPGPDVAWPFKVKGQPEDSLRECGECGAMRVPGNAHLDARDVEAKRPRKRVCMGKVIAG